MPIELRVTHFKDNADKTIDYSKPCYQVSYATEKHGTTHFQRIFDRKKRSPVRLTTEDRELEELVENKKVKMGDTRSGFYIHSDYWEEE